MGISKQWPGGKHCLRCGLWEALADEVRDPSADIEKLCVGGFKYVQVIEARLIGCGKGQAVLYELFDWDLQFRKFHFCLQPLS